MAGALGDAGAVADAGAALTLAWGVSSRLPQPPAKAKSRAHAAAALQTVVAGRTRIAL